MKSQNIQRIEFIDVIRGIASLMVLFQHVFEKIYTSFESYTLNYFNFGIAGVSSFFLVSGFIIPLSLERRPSVKLFIVNRFFRIYPLYIFVLLCTVLILTIKHTVISTSTFIYNLTLFQEYFGKPLYVGLSWTLSLEIVWYAIFAIIFLLSLQKNIFTFLRIAGGLIILISIISLIVGTRFPMGRFAYLYSCLIGLMTYRFYIGDISKEKFKRALFISLLPIIISFYITYGHFHNSIFSLVCVFLSWLGGYLLFFILFITRKNEYKWLWMYLGRISYSTYLLHSIFIGIFFYYFNANIYVGLSIIGMAILSAHYTFLYIETPGIRLGKTIHNKLSQITGSRKV